MARVDLGGLYGHRAVQKDLPVAEAPFVEVAVERVEQHLGAIDGEGGDKNIALAAARAGEDVTQFLPGRVPGAVQAVAIGAFEDDEFRIFFRYYADALYGLLRNRHLGDGRTEDVAGIVQGDRDAGQDLCRLAVRESAEGPGGKLRVAA